MQCDFQCSYCGEWNSTDVDESAGLLQDYVEDCQVCCQPNVLAIRFDTLQELFVIWAGRES
jgi:Cysteine-rich CPXCG